MSRNRRDRACPPRQESLCFGRRLAGWAVLWIALAGCDAANPSGTTDTSGNCVAGGDVADCCDDGEVPIFTTSANGRSQFVECVSESASLEDGNVGAARARLAGEPNDTFLEAVAVEFDSDGSANLQGSVEKYGDLDVYDLGAMAAGDRIVVDLDGLTEEFDASIAVFDDNAALIADNDDEDYDAQNLDSLIDEIVRHDGDPYYLVVGHSAFAAPGWEVGNYVVSVIVERDQAVPAPSGQILFLDFAGGPVESDRLLTNNVPAFDAGAIDSAYEGQDELIKDAILATVNENFEGFDVRIITDPDAVPAGQEYSTVMLGGYSNLAFGIAETVDHYNSDHGDRAVIFAETFSPDKFTSTPTAEELGLAIGNIVAHEAGHLLGLNHVNNPMALMDGVSPADTFVSDQDFMLATLSDDILPIGNQDAPLLLSESIGFAARVRTTSLPTLDGARCIQSGHSGVWCATCGARVP